MRLERHGREPDPNRLTAADAVYLEAFGQPPYHEGHGSAEMFYDRLGRYAARTGFRLALCRSGPDVVGLALSVRAFPGDWWRDHCAATLGPQRTAQWLEPSIREVVHVAVSPQHQRRGAGRLLTEDAVDDSDVVSVVLSCHPEALPAQSLYLACGFELLTTEFRTAPGQLGYWLMARRPVRHAG